jgi:hypothetical protein
MPDDDERLRPWQWPGRWFRDETFWRQATSSVIAALIGATIIFLTARASGFLSEVPWSTILRTLATGSLISVIVSIVSVVVLFLVAWRGP